MEIDLTGHATAEQTLSYFYIPFPVPPHVVRLDVSYEYSAQIGSDPQLSGGNTVDIGIFDPRGIEFMSEGFRGWSGSARKAFFIAVDDATPGYMPGPIQPGEWNVVLGFYKVAEAGCDYHVKIRFTVNADADSGQFPVLLPLSDTPRPDRKKTDGWYKGELHCHTYHSDGDSDPADVVRKAESLGLDFLAITDHNVISHQARLNTVDTTLMLIPGMEVTTYKGHWNIWGDYGWIDFRLLTEDEMRRAVKEAVSRGYLVSCNHPRPYGPPWVFEQIEDFHCIEIWNGPWELMNEVSLEFWETKLRQGKRYPAVGGSDSHFHQRDHVAQLAHPTLYIYCPGDPSPAALLEGLRLGHAFVSDAPDGPELYLQSGGVMMGDTMASPEDRQVAVTLRTRKAQGLTLELFTATGRVQELAVTEGEQQFSVNVQVADSPYLRAQLVETPRKIRAVSNPIYFTGQ